MSNLVFRRVLTTDDTYKKVFDLREDVLRKPIGLSLHNEDLSDEVNDHILVAEQGDDLLGCLILTPKGNGTLQLRQMAVSSKVHGQNIGRQLVDYAEMYAQENDCNKIILHARMVAKGFYEKLHYIVTSDMFTEVGIPHVVMEKQLS
ncbi:MAG: GNAT family N-acetyltransferase [Chitinophagales bacterium]|nr:GNAT family N-acetyltransferase [Chitinophagaceae bacterium]MCB9064125.1 GNAT family N-acetyltransferase [Chitinophagales bacterium]